MAMPRPCLICGAIIISLDKKTKYCQPPKDCAKVAQRRTAVEYHRLRRNSYDRIHKGTKCGVVSSSEIGVGRPKKVCDSCRSIRPMLGRKVKAHRGADRQPDIKIRAASKCRDKYNERYNDFGLRKKREEIEWRWEYRISKKQLDRADALCKELEEELCLRN